jgi:hypothetical protein
MAAASGAPSWQDWAPPLDPPTAGGLPEAQGQAIADTYWAPDPHLAAALMWEAYAATLPQTPAVAQVATGSQSVSYQPPAPGGEYGQAVARAAWHRSFGGTLATVRLDIETTVDLGAWPPFGLSGGDP